MLRLAAELESVLAALDSEPGVVDDGQREVLRQALADALIYRQPGGFCPRCRSEPGGLCFEHAEDAARTNAYLQLAAELGIEVNDR
jgi:hypothetical protein